MKATQRGWGAQVGRNSPYQKISYVFFAEKKVSLAELSGLPHLTGSKWVGLLVFSHPSCARGRRNEDASSIEW